MIGITKVWQKNGCELALLLQPVNGRILLRMFRRDGVYGDFVRMKQEEIKATNVSKDDQTRAAVI